MSENFRLLACYAASVALHVATLILPHVRITPQPHAGTTSVRTVLAANIIRNTGTSQEKDSTHNPTPSADKQNNEPHPPGESPPTSPPSPAAISGETENSPAMELSIDEYLPASMLDKRPTPIGDVDTQVDFKGMYSLVGDAEIMLLISAEGNVDRVLVTGANLPDFIVEQAVERFSAITFTPGEVADLPVRSRIRIRLTPPSQDEMLMNPYSAKQRAWRR